MTLRDLANANANELTLEEWQRLAENIGQSTAPDMLISKSNEQKLFQAYQELVRKKDRKKSGDSGNKKNSADSEEEKARQVLNKLIADNYIFVATDSIMMPNAETAFQRIVSTASKYRKKINILNSTLSEIAVLAKDSDDVKMRELAFKRLEQLKLMQNGGFLSVRSGPNMGTNTSKTVLLTVCANFRLNYPLLVITQDRKLAEDLLSLNRQNSARGNTVIVKRINKYGYLSNVLGSENTAEKFFRICTEVSKEPDRVFNVTKIPGSGETVLVASNNKWQPLQLGEEIGHGGEGAIYNTNTKYVAKIFKKEFCTKYRFEKLKLMISAKLKYKGICFPLSIIVNEKQEFVGYLMEKAEGFSIQSSIFRKPLFQKKLPGWRKEDLVQCAITILNTIRYLHQNNILIGDINPNNFLIKSPTEVYLVDTDSFQINDLPCPVGFPLFTAPEIHARYRSGEFHEYSEILRTPENEYFAVATLMFMLMLPGKPPYTKQGGEDVVDNILEMHFPYAVGTKRGEKVPEGTWRFIWSHLTRRMKENFERVFNKNEDNSEYNIKERLSTDAWLVEMREYLKILKIWTKELKTDPNTIDVDPKSLEIYPNALKRQRGVRYVKCKGEGCTNEFPEDDERLKAGFCPECQKKGSEVLCYSCGKTFVFTNYEKYYKKFSTPPIMCPDCRRRKDEVVETRRCSEPGCRQIFTITRGDKAYLDSKKYQLPKRCPECRKKSGSAVLHKKGMEKQNYTSSGGTYERTNGRTSGGASYGHGSSGQSGCFITTAVCGYLGKTDDCRELRAFRDFRDKWLRYQPGGEDTIQEYYRIAPGLVSRMHTFSDYSKICDTLWSRFLVPCYDMIQKGELEECRKHYTKMVDYLTERVSEENIQSAEGRLSS